MKIKKSLSLFIASAVLASCISLPSLASAAESAVKESNVKGMPSAKTVYTDDNFEDREITNSTSTETTTGDSKIANVLANYYIQELNGNKCVSFPATWRVIKTRTTQGQNIDRLTIAFKIANRTTKDDLQVPVRIFDTAQFNLTSFKDSNKIMLQKYDTYEWVVAKEKGEAVTNSDNSVTYWHDVAVTLQRVKDAEGDGYTAYFEEIVLDGVVFDTMYNKANESIPINTVAMKRTSADVVNTNWWTTVSGKSMVAVGNVGLTGVCLDDFAVYEPGAPEEVFNEKGLNFDVNISGMSEGKLIYTDDNFNDETANGDKNIIKISSDCYVTETDGNKYIELAGWGKIFSRITEGQNVDKVTLTFSVANCTGSDSTTYMRIGEVGYLNLLSYSNKNSILIKEPGSWKEATVNDKGRKMLISGKEEYWHDICVTLRREWNTTEEKYYAYFDKVVVDGEHLASFDGKVVYKKDSSNYANWWEGENKKMFGLGNTQQAGICFDNFAVYVPGFTTHMYPNKAGGITVINRGNSAISGNIVFGFYKDGKLVDVIINPDTIAAAVDEKAEAPILLSDVQYDTVKAFYWNAASMSPLCPTLSPQ